MSDLNLSINLSAIDGASSVIQGVGKAISALASGNVAGAAVAVGAAVVGIGAASVKMAADFQSGITSLSTGAGEAQSNLGLVSNGILDLAVKTGTSTKQLTDGMYMIESAGYHGADGLKVLEAAAEGAKVGNADLGVVANGVTTIMTDFANQNINATQATNTLVATVASGKTTMQDLSGALSGVLPTASAAKVGLTDVMSAMATMTGEGVPAANAATYLRQTIQTLSAPSKGVTDALKSIGLTAGQVSDGLKTSLPNTLHMITEALGKKFPEGSVQYEQALTKIAGGSKQMQGILDLTGSHVNTFAQNFGNIDNAVMGTGSKITGFSQVQDTFNFKMAQAQQVVNTLMIKLGTALLPVLSQIVGAIPGIVTQLGNWGNAIGGLITWLNKHQDVLNILKAAFLTIAIQILSIVIPAFISFAITAIGAAIDVLIAWWPLIAAFALVTAVIYGIIEVVQHWGQISAWFKGVWSAVSSWFMGMLGGLGGFFVGVWNGIVSGLKAAWDGIVSVVRAGAALLLSVIMAPIHAIGALFVWLYGHNTYFKEFVDQIVVIAKAGIALLQAAWQAVVGWLTWLWNGIVGIATTAWNAVSSAVMAVVNTVVGWVAAQWTAFIHQLTALWNTLSGLAQTAWNAVVTVFRNIFGPIGAALGNLWNSISSWFNTLATGAGNAGKNFISMLVSGIASGAGAIWNAVTGIAKSLWKALGFHSPAEEGPGADADKWMPNLVSMLSSGLIAGMPKIQAAVNVVAKPLAMLGSPAAAGVSAPVAAPVAASAGGGASGAPVFYITVQAPALSSREGQTLANEMMKHVDQKLRGSGNHVTWTSGGKR